MEKKSYISSGQVLILLIMTRLPFSTGFFIGLNAGRSIQDVLLAVPVNFLLNFIVALPILGLLKRRPGEDLVECAVNILGRPLGVLVAVFYMVYFLMLAVYMQTNLHHFFINNMLPEAGFFTIVIPMLIVCFFGAVKGIETISRFGVLIITIYLIVLTFITSALVPQIRLSYLSPMLYNGPGILLKSVLSGFNANMQIVLLAFLAPFIRRSQKPGGIYARFNVLASVLYAALIFLAISVLGPFISKQTFPLFALSMQGKLGVFERLDQIDIVSWILNSSLIIMLYLYFGTMCLTKAGLNGYRKTAVFIAALLVLAGTYVYTAMPGAPQEFTLSPVVTAFTVIALILLPLVLLIADLIKRRVSDAPD